MEITGQRPSSDLPGNIEAEFDTSNRVFAILYSNVPNPLVLERHFMITQKAHFKSGIIFVDRQNSKISVPASASFEVIAKIEAQDTRGISPHRIMYIFGVFKACFTHKPSDLYAIYPDMLLAAVFYKIIRPKVRIYYEIQDRNEVKVPLRIVHNLMMLFVTKVFLTSSGFRDEFVGVFSGYLNKRTLFISNCPDSELWGISLEGPRPKRDKKTIGFVGMLRDLEQVEAIKDILTDGRFNVLQAGVSQFEEELQTLSDMYPDALTLAGPFRQSELYEKIYPNIDICWCVYPDTLNYRSHIARRFNESILLGVPVIVGSHAQEMTKVVCTHRIGWVQKPTGMRELLEQVDREIDEISQLAVEVRSKFDFSEHYDVLLKAIKI